MSSRGKLYDYFPAGGFQVVRTGNRPRNPGLKLGRRKRPKARRTCKLSGPRIEALVARFGVEGMIAERIAFHRDGIMLAVLFGTCVDPTTGEPIRLLPDDLAAVMSDFRISGRTIRRLRGRYRAEVKIPARTPAAK